MGLGIGHYIPLVAYLGFWVMTLVCFFGEPLYGLYYAIPFLPYRTMRDHFGDWPLGDNVLTILVLAIILGALLKGKHLARSKLYMTWLIFGIYLYLSLWLGTLLGYGPAPIWTSNQNFATWKDYMLLPLLLVAAGLVIEERKHIRMVVLLTGAGLLFIDRAALMDSLSRSWSHFDEDKRDGGPLGFAGVNGLAAYLVQGALFFWGFLQFVKRRKAKLIAFGLVALSLLAAMYCFSRAGYIGIVVGVFILGLLKDRKLLVVLALFLVTWQTVVPRAVSERVNMTQNSNGQLEASAQERVGLWEEAKAEFAASPVFGEGYATYQLRDHYGGLRDTHNWYVKVLVETGLIGMIFAVLLLQQMLSLSWRLFRRTSDPLYRGLGLGLFLLTMAAIELNLFGDRWTYVEINGITWVLMGAAARALQLSQSPASASEVLEQPEAEPAAAAASANPYLVYR